MKGGSALLADAGCPVQKVYSVKAETIEVEGTVVAALPNAMFRVEIDAGATASCTHQKFTKPFRFKRMPYFFHGVKIEKQVVHGIEH